MIHSRELRILAISIHAALHLPGYALAEGTDCWIEIQKGWEISGAPAPKAGPPIFGALRSRTLPPTPATITARTVIPRPRTGPITLLYLRTDTSVAVALDKRILSFTETISCTSRKLQELIEDTD